MARRPWWQNFQVIAYVVAGLAALGTAIGVASKYLTLPQRVEAGEQKNVVQDKLLDRLTYIAEQQTAQNAYWQKQREPQVWVDEHGTAWCCVQDCDYNDAWYVCN